MKRDDVAIDEATSPSLTERRYVYNEESSQPARDSIHRGNRPVKRRKRSPFNIIVVISIVSLMIVFYVWNKITVNRLAVELNDLQVQYQKVLYANEVFRAEINKKSSLERIGKFASEHLGMTYPKEQPIWFAIDQDQISQLQ